MIVRLVGFALGMGMPGVGLIMPQSWAQRATELAEDYLPDPVRSMALEDTRLSPDAIRLMGIGKVITGWVMVKMAF